VIEVLTNPRARTLCASIAFSYATRALAQANSSLGAQLNDTVTQQAQAKGLTLTGAAQTTPAAPIDVQAQAANPLPDNAGTGLTAFYIALLLLLGGFTGSMVINSVVDGSLGFVPTEIGPIYQLRKRPDLPTAKAVTDFPVGNADGQVGHHVRRRPDPLLGVPPGGLAAGCGPAEYGPALAVRRFPHRRRGYHRNLDHGRARWVRVADQPGAL
jgi:hypothetical protein